MPPEVPPEMIFEHRVYRLPEVLQIVGVSKPTLYRWIRRGKFPSPVLLGGEGSRARGWLGHRLNRWSNSLV